MFVFDLDRIKIVLINVSETSSKKIFGMMKDDGFDASQDYVRLGEKSCCCSGLLYNFTFNKSIGENAKVFEYNHTKMAVEKK